MKHVPCPGEIGVPKRQQMPPRHGKQRLRPGDVAPIAGIGRQRLRLIAEKLAPQPADQPKAVTANTFETRLMVIGRADPAAGRGNNLLARGHETVLALQDEGRTHDPHRKERMTRWPMI